MRFWKIIYHPLSLTGYTKKAAALAEEARIRSDKQQTEAEKYKRETLEQKKVPEKAHMNAEMAKTEALEHKKVFTKVLRDAAETNQMTELNMD